MPAKRLTQEEFLQRAKAIHGDKYDYSLSKYVNHKIKMTIICPSHGKFSQLPSNHLAGHGCYKCREENRYKCRAISQENFIKRARLKHGNRYDYSKCIYTHMLKKVTIICKKHGEFQIHANNHVRGFGCKKCVHEIRFSVDEFIKRAKKIHGRKYNYDLVKSQYVNMRTNVEIICPIHGLFKQTPYSHLQGNYCFKCAMEKRASRHQRMSQKEFVDRARKIHRNKYDYSKTIHDPNIVRCLRLSLVTITCPKHGDFKQTAQSHLAGNGCPKCNHIISKLEVLWLDKMKVPRNASNRHVTLKIDDKCYIVDGIIKNTIYEFYGDYWHGNPQKYNLNDINKVCKKSFGQLYEKTINKERVLRMAGYKMITIWESDFNKKLKTN